MPLHSEAAVGSLAAQQSELYCSPGLGLPEANAPCDSVRLEKTSSFVCSPRRNAVLRLAEHDSNATKELLRAVVGAHR